MDWNVLLAPVIITLVPILVAVIKKAIPDKFSFVIPLLAGALGPLLDFISLKATGISHGSGVAIAYGLAGVGVREAIDQLRKIQNGPTIAKTLLLVTLGAATLSGCAHSLGYAGAHPGYVECKGKGSITGTGSVNVGAGVGGGGVNVFTIQADCGDGFSLKQGPAPGPLPTPPK